MELLALLGSQYDETSDARLRYALGLPDDFPIGRTIVASVTDGPGGSEVAADIGPRCSLRDGDSEEEAIAFTHCHAAAAADPNCTVQTRYLIHVNDDGSIDITGVDIYCADPKF